MSIGFNLPHYGPMAYEADGIPRFARAMEDLGATSLWVGDRLLAPLNPTVGYLDYGYFPEEFRTVYDPLTAVTVAATATSRIRLGISAIIAVWYPPALLARILTSIDLASGGRLMPGFGLGWNPEEFTAAGVPFEGRAARMDELLDVLEAFWTTSPVEHHGPMYEIPPSHIDLKPAQRPRPPIYLAAAGPRSLRRVGERGDGWLMLLNYPPNPVMNMMWDAIRQAAEAAGRDPATIKRILRINVDRGTSTEAIAAMITESGPALGADEIFVDLTYVTKTVDQAIDTAHDLMELVSVRV